MARKATTRKACPKKSRSIKPDPAERRRAARIYRKLLEQYPEAHCELDHRDPFQLLVATILSAQCTDARVNMVTPDLFKAYPDAQAMAKARRPTLERLIKSTGFFRNKARSIQGCALAIVQDHGGKVPDTMDALLEFPGVARKTANVVLGNAFGKNEGVVVDTHVSRLSQRLGVTSQKDPTRIELNLMALFSPDQWILLAHLLIFHGRRLCTARNPECDRCPLRRDCPRVGVKTKT